MATITTTLTSLYKQGCQDGIHAAAAGHGEAPRLVVTARATVKMKAAVAKCPPPVIQANGHQGPSAIDALLALLAVA